MRHRLARLALAALPLAMLACSLVTPPTPGTSSLGSVAELWDDVPRMDGLAAVDEDLPLFAQVLVRGLVRNLMGGGEGAGNWLLYTTDQTPATVAEFYTEERMAEHGWKGSGRNTCTDGGTQGIEEVGVICFFQKQVGGEFQALLIVTVANQAPDTGDYLAFVRIEAEATPEPTP